MDDVDIGDSDDCNLERDLEAQRMPLASNCNPLIPKGPFEDLRMIGGRMN